MTLPRRLKTGEPSGQRELLRKAYNRIHGPFQVRGGEPGCYLANKRASNFLILLNIGTNEAFLGAAMMLRPDGWKLALIQSDHDWLVEAVQIGIDYDEGFVSQGSTAAYAYAAACIRAKGVSHAK
jgi:hypothetical protein